MILLVHNFQQAQNATGAQEKPGSHMPEVCLRLIPAVFFRHMRTLIADLSLVLQAVTNVVGGMPGELTGVQLSRLVAGKRRCVMAYFCYF